MSIEEGGTKGVNKKSARLSRTAYETNHRKQLSKYYFSYQIIKALLNRTTNYMNISNYTRSTNVNNVNVKQKWQQRARGKKNKICNFCLKPTRRLTWVMKVLNEEQLLTPNCKNSSKLDD